MFMLTLATSYLTVVLMGVGLASDSILLLVLSLVMGLISLATTR